MKLLVTGHNGQLARCLQDRASSAGFELLALGRPQLDLLEPKSIEKAVAEARPDLIINTAAYTAVDLAEDDVDAAWRINAEAPAVLAASTRRLGVPLIHLSTDYVFDGEQPGLLNEEAPTRPINVYGASKLAGEEAVRREAGEHLILRTAWVYSRYGRNFLLTMLALAQAREVVTVVADQAGSPSSADDLARAILRAVEVKRACGGRWESTYHLAGRGIATWAEFATTIFQEAGQRGLPLARVEPISTADWPTKARRPRSSALDSSRFEQDFDHLMPHWRDSVAALIEKIALVAGGARLASIG